MFNLGGKREKDPKKALENADKALNKGLSGALVKGFMGKDFTEEMNSALDMGKQAIEGVEQGQWLAQNGLEAEAEVVSVADTGQTINMNPVVVLNLEVDLLGRHAVRHGRAVHGLAHRRAARRRCDQDQVQPRQPGPVHRGLSSASLNTYTGP